MLNQSDKSANQSETKEKTSHLTRHHAMTDADHIQRFLDDTSTTVEQLGKEWGKTVQTVRAWLKNNEAPVWSRCAVEGLRRRTNTPDTTGRVDVFVARCQKEQARALAAFCAAMKIPFQFMDN